MSKRDSFIDNNPQKMWQKYCGFFDLSLEEFMEIQENLLLEEIELVSGSPIGEKIMKSAKPRSVEEFRRLVPLTTYDDYEPYIGNCQEDALAETPRCWTRTSGRGGRPKWIPYTQKAYERLGMLGVTIFILACASKKGEVLVNRNTHFMQNLPPSPFYSGVGAVAMLEHFPLHMIPPLELAETMPFEERIQTGFEIALRTGIDVLGSLTTVLIKMGERFTESSRGMKLSRKMLHPLVMFRLIRGFLWSKRERRALLPKDLWPLKGLLCYGMETSIYKEQVKYYWGKDPLEVYGGTEAGAIAIQSWARKGMTFLPFACFLEFIPEEEWAKSQEDGDYQPSTVLLDEVEKGKRYEIVLTNFYGMPLLRYRVGDLIKIIDLQEEETGIQIPQMVFDSRADDLIDIAGFTRLDEKTIWQAIANTGIKYEDWSIRKEYEQGQPILHLYIETKDRVESKEAERLIHNELCSINEDYRNLQDMLGIQPLKVTLLPQGNFRRYYEEKRKAGADLSHLKPPHMNAPDQAIQELLRSA